MSDVNAFEGFDVKATASSPAAHLAPTDIEVQRFLFNVLPGLPLDLTRMVCAGAEKRVRDLEAEMGLPSSSSPSQVYGPNYDIKQEIDALIQAVRAMQDSVMVNGRIREGITPKEMREVVSSTTSLMSLLMRAHEKLLSLDRVRSIEQATIAVLRELGDDALVERFVTGLEEELARLSG